MQIFPFLHLASLQRLSAHRGEKGKFMENPSTLETPRDFGRALEHLEQGYRVARKGWNAHHTLGLQVPDDTSANTLPYIFMVVGTDAADMQGKRVPWVASQTDLLAEDWSVVE
jgi:hypothetical protein